MAFGKLGSGFGRLGRSGRNSASGPSLQTVNIPAGMGWSPSWSIKRTAAGGTYSISGFDFDAAKPTPDYIYYLDPAGSSVASPASDDPNTPITGNRFRALCNLSPTLHIEGRCKSGMYWGTMGVNGSNIQSGVTLVPWVGQQSAAPGRPVMIQRSTNLAAPWTADTGTTYYTAHTSTNACVFDYLYVTDRCPQRLEYAADLTTCRATPGTCFHDTGTNRMYVNASDGRNLNTTGTLMVVTTGGTGYNSNSSTANRNYYFDGIDIVLPTTITQNNVGSSSNFYARNCGFFGGGSCLQLAGKIDGILMGCRAGGGTADGYNYHYVSGVGITRVLEFQCGGIYSGWLAGGLINNATTLHDGCLAVSVASVFPGSQNRTMHDVINATKRFAVGCTVGASRSSDATAVTVCSGQADGETTEMWLQDCSIAASFTAHLYAFSGCKIHTAEINTGGFVTGGTGTIDTFTPS